MYLKTLSVERRQLHIWLKLWVSVVCCCTCVGVWLCTWRYVHSTAVIAEETRVYQSQHMWFLRSFLIVLRWSVLYTRHSTNELLKAEYSAYSSYRWL